MFRVVAPGSWPTATLGLSQNARRIFLAGPGGSPSAANFGPKVGVGGERGPLPPRRPRRRLALLARRPPPNLFRRCRRPRGRREPPALAAALAPSARLSGGAEGTRVPRRGAHTLARKARPRSAPRPGEECPTVVESRAAPGPPIAAPVTCVAPAPTPDPRLSRRLGKGPPLAQC